MACRGFWECLLKLLNFLLILVGLAMIGYGIYLFVEYKNAASPGDDAPLAPPHVEFVQLGRPMLLAVSLADNIFDKLPKAWFIYLFTGIGVIVLMISCCGCIGTVMRNGCCLTCYSVLVILLILAELGMAAFIFFDKSWKEEIPTDKTGNFDMMDEFLEEHWKIIKWVALGVVVLEALLFLLALIVRAANKPADYDSDEEYIGGPRQQIRQPLINRPAAPTTGGPVVGTLDQRPSRNDAWSQRMREKYGLDTSEFTYSPSESNRYQQAAIQPSEERREVGRCFGAYYCKPGDSSDSSFVPPLIYSVLGSSRHLAVGPVSIASLVMGTMLNEAVSYAEEPILYLKLAFTATFFAGVFQASLGFLRLGFVIDFLSKATLVGFTAGAAVIVSLQQLKGLLGIVHFTNKMQLIPVLSSVFHEVDEWSWQTIVVGVAFLAFLLITRHISLRKPRLFWISAAAPLASVVLSTVLVVCLKSKAPEIKTIGHLAKGLNPPSSNMLYFNGPYLALAIKTGIVTGILSLTEGIAVGRTFAALKNYQVDGNKEMMAIGLMNMAGSCSSCYVTTGSFSRSAVNYNAGAQTVVSNIIMASAVLVTLLFLMPLFYYTPNLILAAIIITAVVGLIDYQAAYKLWKVDKLDFLACLCSFLGVLFISVPLGLAIAVAVSVFKILLHVTRPNTVVLGNIPGTQIYQNLSRYKEAVRVPSFLILAVEAPFYFANSTYLQERIQRWIREEEEWLASNERSDIKCVILDMTAVTAIDTSGIDTINELRKMLDKRSLKLVLANPVGSVMEKLHQSNVLESFGLEGLYLTVGEAIADISSAWKAQP